MPLSTNNILDLAQKIRIQNKFEGKYVGIVDFTQMADKPRLFIVNVQTNNIEHSLITTHGKGSGGLPKATSFSNVPNSNKSSSGLMKTAEIYYGKHGRSLRLDGLEKGINDKVRERAIVMHRSDYTTSGWLKKNRYPGRSLGCITMEPTVCDTVLDKMKGGSPLFTYTGKEM